MTRTVKHILQDKLQEDIHGEAIASDIFFNDSRMLDLYQIYFDDSEDKDRFINNVANTFNLSFIDSKIVVDNFLERL